jgi:hypothetical protein
VITFLNPELVSYHLSSAEAFYPFFALSAFLQNGADFELCCRGSAGDKGKKLQRCCG